MYFLNFSIIFISIGSIVFCSPDEKSKMIDTMQIKFRHHLSFPPEIRTYDVEQKLFKISITLKNQISSLQTLDNGGEEDVNDPILEMNCNPKYFEMLIEVIEGEKFLEVINLNELIDILKIIGPLQIESDRLLLKLYKDISVSALMDKNFLKDMSTLANDSSNSIFNLKEFQGSVIVIICILADFDFFIEGKKITFRISSGGHSRFMFDQTKDLQMIDTLIIHGVLDNSVLKRMEIIARILKITEIQLLKSENFKPDKVIEFLSKFESLKKFVFRNFKFEGSLDKIILAFSIFLKSESRNTFFNQQSSNITRSKRSDLGIHGLTKTNRMCITELKSTNSKELDLSFHQLDKEELRAIREFRTLEKLDLSHCLIKNQEEIFANGLKGLQLQELDLSFNILVKEDLKTIATITSLRKLDLTQCELEESTEEALNDLQFLNLEELNLSHNVLGINCVQSIFKINTLKKLDISHCNIREGFLHSLLDSSLSNLEELNVGYNEMNTKDIEKISKMQNLKKLRLNFCSLDGNENHSINSLQKLKLEELDLSMNKITTKYISVISHITTLKILDLSFSWICSDRARLDGLENLQLEKLYLNFNVDITPQDLKTISKITTLKKLELNNCNLGPKPKAVTDLKNLSLTELSMFDNNLDPGDFRAIFKIKTLKSLNLRKTITEQLNQADIKNLTDLETLNLSENRFTQRMFKSICQMTTLKELYLKDCNLDDINLDTLMDLPLTVLDLSQSPLKKHDLILLSNIPTLEKLFLKSCKITEHTIGHLKHHTLTTLDLSNNSLPDLISISDNLPSLTHLTLVNCNLTHLNFSGFSNLESLDLSENPLITYNSEKNSQEHKSSPHDFPGQTSSAHGSTSSTPASPQKSAEKKPSTSPKNTSKRYSSNRPSSQKNSEKIPSTGQSLNKSSQVPPSTSQSLNNTSQVPPSTSQGLNNSLKKPPSTSPKNNPTTPQQKFPSSPLNFYDHPLSHFLINLPPLKQLNISDCGLAPRYQQDVERVMEGVRVVWLNGNNLEV